VSLRSVIMVASLRVDQLLMFTMRQRRERESPHGDRYRPRMPEVWWIFGGKRSEPWKVWGKVEFGCW